MKLSPDCYKKNELEMALIMAEKLLSDKAGGLIFNKGDQTESRLSYKQAAETIASLLVYFASEGCFSFSICKTCKSFNPKAVTRPGFGACRGSYKYQYSTCGNHSKNDEAWGL